MTLDDLYDEGKQFHNHICILYDMTLVRFIGVAEDDDDCYYIVREIGKPKEYWASAVGFIISLKGKYPEPRYNNMDNLFELNGAEKTEEFLKISKLGESTMTLQT